jgi:hypothetical protein
MKKSKFLMGAMLFGAMALVACGDGAKQDMDNIVEDGFYVVGPATAVNSLDADNAAKGLMGAGINEATKETRDGLYEKYVALEGGQEFELVLKEGELITHYGAELVLGDPYDVGYGVTIQVYKGALVQNVKMKMPESGFYHIALDLNKKGDLPEPSIIVAPVEWEINADASKKLTPSAFNKESMTWVLEGIEMASGSKYKYAYGNGWKIKVTPAQDVNIETNLGEGMKSGAADIVVNEAGVYTFKLVWNLAGGQIEKNFKDETFKTADLVLNPAEFVMGISGTMNSWGDPAGATLAKFNSGKSNVTNPTTKDGTYVYNITGLTFDAGSQFKFRSNGAWLGFGEIEISGVTPAGEQGGDISGVEGCYDIEMTLEWQDGKTVSIKAAFTEGTPSAIEYKDITVTGLVPEGWEHCYIWAWDADGNNYTGGTWPGEELTIVDNKVSKSFTQVPVPISVIFSDGDKKQTNDIGGISGDIEIDIAANLK